MSDRRDGGVPAPGADRVHGGADCERVRRMAAEGRLGAEHPLGPDEVRHLAECAVCRSEAAALDPLAAFVVLARETKPDAFWTGFETRVLAEIRAEERGRAEARGGLLGRLFRPRLAALTLGAAAIAAIAVVFLRVPAPNDGGGAGAGRLAADAGSRIVPGPGAGASGRAGVDSEDSLDTRGGGAGPASVDAAWRIADADAANPVPVEGVTSPTAQVLSMNVSDQTDVVVIVGVDI